MTNTTPTEIERVLTGAVREIQDRARSRNAYWVIRRCEDALARVAALRTQQEAEVVDATSNPLVARYIAGDSTALLDCALQVYARACMYDTEAQHSAAMAYRAELIRRLTALPTHQAPQAEAVHQWCFSDQGRWIDGAPDEVDERVAKQSGVTIETRTLYREPVVTAKAQGDAKLDMEYTAGARAALRMLAGGMPESEILDRMRSRCSEASAALASRREAT